LIIWFVICRNKYKKHTETYTIYHIYGNFTPEAQKFLDSTEIRELSKTDEYLSYVYLQFNNEEIINKFNINTEFKEEEME